MVQYQFQIIDDDFLQTPTQQFFSYKHNALLFGHHYAQAHTNNVNKTQVLLQTTGGDI
jgi:hypothetical protein